MQGHAGRQVEHQPSTRPSRSAESCSGVVRQTPTTWDFWTLVAPDRLTRGQIVCLPTLGDPFGVSNSGLGHVGNEGVTGVTGALVARRREAGRHREGTGEAASRRWVPR